MPPINGGKSSAERARPHALDITIEVPKIHPMPDESRGRQAVDAAARFNRALLWFCATSESYPSLSQPNACTVASPSRATKEAIARKLLCHRDAT